MKEFPNLTLKNLKFFEAGSEETPCFTADLYDNGKLVGHVSNDGHGGCNRIYFAKGLKGSDVIQYDMDVDAYIMELAEIGNALKKYQGKNIVLEKNGQFLTTSWNDQYGKKISISQMKKRPDGLLKLQRARDKYIVEGYNVLNTNF